VVELVDQCLFCVNELDFHLDFDFHFDLPLLPVLPFGLELDLPFGLVLPFLPVPPLLPLPYLLLPVFFVSFLLVEAYRFYFIISLYLSTNSRLRFSL